MNPLSLCRPLPPFFINVSLCLSYIFFLLHNSILSLIILGNELTSTVWANNKIFSEKGWLFVILDVACDVGYVVDHKKNYICVNGHMFACEVVEIFVASRPVSVAKLFSNESKLFERTAVTIQKARVFAEASREFRTARGMTEQSCNYRRIDAQRRFRGRIVAHSNLSLRLRQTNAHYK